MAKLSKKVERLRKDLDRAARARYGPRWITPLAKAAGWPPATLRTFLARGQKLPEADKLAALERAAGLIPHASSSVREAVEPYLLQEVREVRSFTSLVEALRKIDRSDGDIYRAAWRVLMASAEALRALAGWTEEDWKETITKDHWKTLTKEPEERTVRRALDYQIKEAPDG